MVKTIGAVHFQLNTSTRTLLPSVRTKQQLSSQNLWGEAKSSNLGTSIHFDINYPFLISWSRHRCFAHKGIQFSLGAT